MVVLPPCKYILYIDQVPLPFAIDRSTTYELEIPKEQRGLHKVWVRNPASGLEKRQYTLELASPKGTNIRPGIIFRGTGKRISQDEIQTYHKSVDIFWQANAWMDTNVCVDWAQKTLAPAVKKANS